jgi:hypothetical protein
MSEKFIDYSYTAHLFFDGVLQRTGRFQPLLWAIAVVLVAWLLLWLLYKKRIFLRV